MVRVTPKIDNQFLLINLFVDPNLKSDFKNCIWRLGCQNHERRKSRQKGVVSQRRQGKIVNCPTNAAWPMSERSPTTTTNDVKNFGISSIKLGVEGCEVFDFFDIRVRCIKQTYLQQIKIGVRYTEVSH